jgi:rhodanese-related sulfurtransferase
VPALWWLPLGRVPEIEPHELNNWLNSGRQLQFVDARTAIEYSQGTINAACHAPLTEMPGSMSRLDLDPTLPVVVLCLTGHRSLPGTRWLLANRYEAYSLKGGLRAWKRLGYELQIPNGKTKT